MTSVRTRPGRAMDERIRQRRAAVRRQAVRRRRRVAGSLCAIAVLAGLAAVAAYSPLFSISSVRITGVVGEQAAAVKAAARVREGGNLLRLDAGAARDRVLTLPWVRDAAVRRVPPASVEVAVTVREPAAVVRLPASAWVVDADGVVLEGGSREGLVVVMAPNSVLPGAGQRVSDAAVRNALAVHQALPGPMRTAALRYEATSARDLRLLLDVPDLAGGREGVWVRIGRAERVEAKAQVVGLLLEQARDQAEREGPEAWPGLAEIDVRVPDNPVLVPAERVDAS